MHYAAFKGHLEICKFLMEKGAKENFRDLNGFTPLHFAAINGHIEVCKLIAANLDDKSPKANNGYTPAMLLKKFFQYKASSIFNEEI